MSNKTLYLGLHPPKNQENIVHFPVIYIEPISADNSTIVEMMKKWNAYTHLICTSRSTVKILSSYCQHYNITTKDKVGIAVGQKTAIEMRSHNFPVHYIAENEQAEGVIDLLQNLELSDSHLLWPHSSLSRKVLNDYMDNYSIHYTDVVIYRTTAVKIPIEEAPPLDHFDKIVFTSPSTVHAFIGIYGTLNVSPKLVPIGPITAEALSS